MFKKMFYFLLFYVTLGLIVSVLQHLVLLGFPFNPDKYFLEEWLGSSLYIFLFIQMQRRVLKSLILNMNERVGTIPLIMKYFLLLQLLGFVLLMSYSILITVLIKGSLEIQLKDVVQLRFIFVYFFFIHSVLFITEIALRFYRLYITEREAKYRAEKSFLSTQLQMLRQQLNPHFLFNNLNIIASTVNSNPQLAYKFTRSMASFYRKVLETENSGLIGLNEELKTIQAYLYMLSVRFEEKLNYVIDVTQSVQQSFFIPDFILQPIVENAVKHNTCSKSSPLEIIISINEEGSLEVKNNYQPKEGANDSLGIGWFNIESRYKYLGAKAPEKFLKDGWYYVVVPLFSNSNVKVNA
jgi:two-component system, LytTR family, sensor kinase